MVTNAGIEPAIQGWKPCVLSISPIGHFGGVEGNRSPVFAMARQDFTTKLQLHFKTKLILSQILKSKAIKFNNYIKFIQFYFHIYKLSPFWFIINYMMKIKLTDIDDQTEIDWPYLKQNPEYSKQLVATLNQLDGFSSNELEFAADSDYWTYDYSFSPNYEIDKEAFAIVNDQICIRSLNRDDLLNLNYYQCLNDLANNYPIEKWWWSYYAQDQVLQLETYWWSHKPYLNIKLTKPIDQYSQNQLNAIGALLTNVHDLIKTKDYELDWDQFVDQWKQEFDLDEVRAVGIVFDLNDFANPKLLIRWRNEKYQNRYENNDLKQVLKADSELLTFLNNNNFQADFSIYQSKAHKFFKRFLDA